jgi:hypothetical protein
VLAFDTGDLERPTVTVTALMDNRIDTRNLDDFSGLECF